MNTHSFIPAMREGRKGIGLPALSILIGAVLAAQLLLPSVASARSTINLASTPPTLSDKGLLNLTGVSVVRIVTIYGNLNRPQPTTVDCTGLGALVGSWPSSSAPAAPYRNWVLTDGALLSPTANADCSQGTALSLLGIQVLASDEYTNTTHNFAMIAALNCIPRNTNPPTSACSDGTAGTNGTGGTSEKIDFSTSNGTAPVGALFSFATDSQHPQPYLTFDANAATSEGKGFGLLNKN